MRKSKRYKLSICIVLYNPNRLFLGETLNTLLIALQKADILYYTRLCIVDNSEQPCMALFNDEIFAKLNAELVYGHGNVGFAQGHNLALRDDLGEYHLVLNPDVQLHENSIIEAVHFMNSEHSCGLLTAAATYPDGRKQYLCKQYPAVFDLFLRGFAPNLLKKLFLKRLSRYEMQLETQDALFWDPPIVSGCFMFFRGETFERLKGFDPSYMLYFEDFDISLRTSKIARIAYVPSVKIVHHGGNAARKGWWHIKQFLRSATIFFWFHGIRLF